MYPHCERIFGAKYSELEQHSKGTWVTFVIEEYEDDDRDILELPKSACNEIERMAEENERLVLNGKEWQEISRKHWRERGYDV